MAIIPGILALSPLPIVNLEEIAVPQDGVGIATSSACKRHFSKSDKCFEHYERLRTSPELEEKAVQCPFGFSSFMFRTGSMSLVLTGVVPYPRLGGDAERRIAKENPKRKVSQAAFRSAAELLRSTEITLISILKEMVERQSVALHEIRKLNRTVKQTAERMCRQASPGDPDLADAQLVKIWKSAELMSMQFDVIEVLANEDLFRLPLNTVAEVYRLFDKCVRIYRPTGALERISIHSQQGYRPQILACDKTIHIIPTALIENALKYSIPSSQIHIDLRKSGVDCVITVRNEYEGNKALTDKVFEQGVRFNRDKEGSGTGLYLAQLVAKQHNAYLKVSSRQVRPGVHECTFTLIVPEAEAHAASVFGNDEPY